MRREGEGGEGGEVVVGGRGGKKNTKRKGTGDLVRRRTKGYWGDVGRL